MPHFQSGAKQGGFLPRMKKSIMFVCVLNEPTIKRTAVGSQENKALLVWRRIWPWWMRLCLVHIFSNTHVMSSTFWSNISFFWGLCISIHILHDMVAVFSDRQLAERRPETNFLKESHHALIFALRQSKISDDNSVIYTKTFNCIESQISELGENSKYTVSSWDPILINGTDLAHLGTLLMQSIRKCRYLSVLPKK